MARSSPILTTPPRLTAVVGLYVAIFCLITACSSTPKPQDTAKKALSGTDEQIFLGDSVKKNYDPNVIMKRGEAFFEKEEYTEAIVEYTHFLDLHRTHILAPYAEFRIGESQMKLAKGIQRDPGPIQKALEAFERLRKSFPGSRYDGPALQKIQECHDLLAQTHLFVGEFYYRRGSYLAAAHRFEQIMKLYPDKSPAPDALYFLALSYHDLGADDWASEKLTLLAEKYPGSTYSSEGKSLLAKIGVEKPTTLLALKADPVPSSNSPAVSPRETQPSLPAELLSSTPSRSVSPPSATALSQSFVNCRLNVWCGEKPSTLLALNVQSVPSSSSSAAPPPRNQPSVNQVLKNQPMGKQSGRVVGLIPSAPSRSFSLPSATSLSQSFVQCRLGVWC
jgi:outer membrane protein assembly factor BamD